MQKEIFGWTLVYKPLQRWVLFVASVQSISLGEIRKE
jgi:hypothetical protein